jgi:ubiquinone/menaquinone biosynthesis C-methylase UbiE
MGIHRYWKHCFVNELGCLTPQRVYTHRKENPLVRVLDVAGGTGDIAFRILENHNRNSNAHPTQISKSQYSTSTPQCLRRARNAHRKWASPQNVSIA